MAASPPMPPSADDVWQRMDAARSRPMLGLAVVGALLVVGTVVWWPHLVVYLVGLGLLALGLVSAGLRLLRGGRRWVAVGLVGVLTALAVLVPWWAAQRERTGSPHWTLETNGNVWDEYLDVDRNRYLGEDDRSLFAVDLTDGSVLWSVIELGRVDRFDVSADGYVLARGDDETAWISPDGEILWRMPQDGGADDIGTVSEWGVVGASGDIAVFEHCDEDDACITVGVGPDGAEVWRIEGYRTGYQDTAGAQVSEDYDAPRELPEALVIGQDQSGTKAAVVDAATGKVTETIQTAGGIAISGRQVVYEAEVEEEAAVMCRSRGTDLDRTIDWEAQTPCLHGSAEVLGTWLYGAYEAPEGEVSESFAIDMTSGSWTDVGVLAWFNVDADAIGGVPGDDVVVQRDHQQLTGLDPATGEQLWTYRAEDATGGIPGVDVMNGAVAVLTYPERGHNPFLSGRDRGQLTVLLDAATGRVTARLWLAQTVWDVDPCGPGRAVVADSSQLSLIGTAP